MITMKDIAVKANVSQTTVSRVFNSNTYVNADTKKIVLKVAKDLGYKVNTHIKKSPKKSLIAVILPNISNPFFAEILTAVEQESSSLDYHVIFMNSHDDLFLEKQCIKKAIGINVMGLMVVTNNDRDHYLEEYKDKIKIISITKIINGIDSVAISHKVGAELVVKHLLSLGYEKIGFIGHKGHKYDGFKEELRRQNIDLDDSKYIEYDLKFTKKEIKAHIEACLAKYTDAQGRLTITAIFATYDILAFEIINVLKEKGYKIPEDIAVIGFDNTFLSKSLGISTVSQPISEMTHIGFELLLEATKSSARKKAQKILLRPRLIPRSTTLNTIQLP